MRTLLASTLALAIGLSLGWYCGYTRPIAHNSWRIAQTTGMSPQEITDAYKNPDATLRSLIGTEQHASAILSLSVLSELEAGQADRAKEFLAHRVADYYNTFYKFDAPSPNRQKFLTRIEEVSEKSPTLKEALAKKPQ